MTSLLLLSLLATNPAYPPDRVALASSFALGIPNDPEFQAIAARAVEKTVARQEGHELQAILAWHASLPAKPPAEQLVERLLVRLDLVRNNRARAAQGDADAQAVLAKFHTAFPILAAGPVNLTEEIAHAMIDLKALVAGQPVSPEQRRAATESLAASWPQWERNSQLIAELAPSSLAAARPLIENGDEATKAATVADLKQIFASGTLDPDAQAQARQRILERLRAFLKSN